MDGYGPAVAASMVDRANEIHEENKQKKDEARAHDISQLILDRDDYINKIPTLQKGTPEYQEAHAALQDVNGNIADFYHPVRNPGAIEKFGHLLTDHLKLTNPQDRAEKQEKEKHGRTDAAAKETDRQIASAPAGPEQQAVQSAQARSAAALAGYQADLQAAKKINPNMSPEDEEALASELKQKYFGETAKGNWANVAGTIDGNPTNLLFNKSTHQYLTQGGSPLPPEMVEKFVPTVKETTASTNISGYKKAVEEGFKGSYPKWLASERRAGAPSLSTMNRYATAYAKAYGLSSVDDLTPQDWDFIERKQAWDKAIPQTTTTNTTKQNSENQWVPVQETNTKSPGGGAPAPPRGNPINSTPPPTAADLAAPERPATPAAAMPPTATNPRALKKEAEERKPTGAASTGANASVKVGTPLFAAPNKEYNDAKTAYDAAVHRKTLMHKNMQDALANKEDQQAMLSLVANHIGMTLGAQKGARINQAVWNEAVASRPWLDGAIAKFGPDGYLTGVTLSPGQMKQMVKLADESTDVTKEDMERIKTRMNEGITQSNSGDKSDKENKGAVPKGATHKVRFQGKWYYADKDGNNLGEVPK